MLFYHEMLDEDDISSKARLIVVSLLVFLSIYFLATEIYQFVQTKPKWKYFCDYWNYFDLIPPFFIIWTIEME